MRKILLTAAAITLGASLSAQAYITAPGGFTTKQGGYYAVNWGHYLLNMRSQVCDPTLAKSAVIMLEMSWRSSQTFNYRSANNQARKWTKWTLSLGRTDLTKWSSKFSLNPIGAMTTVYSGAFSLPNVTSKPTTNPWGNAGNVKFSKIYLYNGKNDLLQEYQAENGVHANGFTSFNPYYVDACRAVASNQSILYAYPDSPTAPGSKWLPASPYNKRGKNCLDSSQTTMYYDAYSYLYVYLYRNNYRTTSLRCKLRPTTSNGYYMAKSAKFIGALTVGGSDAGIPIGAKCQRLHVNMGFPVAIIPGTTNTLGHTPNAVPNNTYFNYQKWYAGICLYWQHAWEDSKTKRLSLTVASKVCIPDKDKLPGQNCAGYGYVYRYRPTPGANWSPSSTDASYGFRGLSTTSSSIWNALDRIRTK